MHYFDKTAAQGDLHIERIDVLPKDAESITPEGDKIICAHSETGHHHTVAVDHVTAYRADNQMMMYLEVHEEAPRVHERSFDTHASIALTPGVYRLRRQREYTPEGWQRVAD